MPRTKRVVVPHYPHHIVHRGHNGRDIFSSDEDRIFYLENLREWKTHYECEVYGYCLMSNHVHLILAAGPDPGSLGQLMKRIAARQTRRINKRESRRGTLWEGKYRSSLIQADRYLLACSRYVELNPVRAGVVDRPELYRWSSYRHKIGLTKTSWLNEDTLYRGLGRNPRERQRRYKRWIEKTVPPKEEEMIRLAARRGQLTGGRTFIDEVLHKAGWRIEFRGQGRPQKINRTPFSVEAR